MVKKNGKTSRIFWSRRLLSFIIILFLFLGIGNFARKPTQLPTANFPLTAKVKEVVDGDTIILKGGEKVRYVGINAPEVRVWDGRQWISQRQICGEEAVKFNQKLVEGKKITLEYDRVKKDIYGRTLAYVWVNGVLANEELVKRGLALVDFRAPNLKYQVRFSAVQKEARKFRRGLWGKTEKYSFPQW
ncbi:MAG: thermonuclease family protein, partial [Desulfobacterota bacterium]|nr:thermonuclease family protein [Thermodesulfobacteriota bacterium]